MNWTLAILHVLASDAGRPFTIEEISRAIKAQPDRLESIKQLPPSGDVDIFRSELISHVDGGWQITEAGLSTLRSLEAAFSTHQSPSATSPAWARDMIHELEAIGGRVDKFHAKPEQAEGGLQDRADPIRSFGRDEENAMAMGGLDRGHAPVDLDHARRTPDGDHNQAPSAAPPVAHLPPFLRPGAGYGPQSNDGAPPSSIFSRLVAAKNLLLLQGINLHSAKNVLASTLANGSPRAQGVAFAMLALFGIVAVVFLLSQVVTYKSENRLLQREVSKLRENLGRMEQAVKTEKDADQKKPESSADLEIRTDQRSGFELSNDEIQSIREYIKPAPYAGVAGPVINIGEPFEGATIPLPAPLMEKIPKLLGGRFAIRNGAIVILKSGSDRVNAVLHPN